LVILAIPPSKETGSSAPARYQRLWKLGILQTIEKQIPTEILLCHWTTSKADQFVCRVDCLNRAPFFLQLIWTFNG